VKNVLYILAITFFAIIVLPVKAATLTGVNSVTLEQFSTYFDLNGTHSGVVSSDVRWYAQLQAGIAEPEIEIGANSYYDSGDTSWSNNVNSPFTLSVDGANYLHLTGNGIPTGAGLEVPISNDFNEIWIGIMLNTGVPEDVFSASSQVLNGSANLLNLSVTGSDNNPENIQQFSGFKITFNGNIGAFNITGDINPNMRFGSVGGESWTWTAVGVAVPEPSPLGLLLLVIVILPVVFRRRYTQSSYSQLE